MAGFDDIQKEMERARAQAEAYAREQYRDWMGALRDRVESDFLPWYFSYWNQLVAGLKKGESLFDYLDEMRLGLERETLAVVDEVGDAIRGGFGG